MPPCVVDETDDLLVDLADQHHLGDLEGGRIRDPKAVDERGLDPQLGREPGDLGATAVHDQGPDAEHGEQDDVVGEPVAKVVGDHGRAAVLDDHRGPREATQRTASLR